VVFGLAADSNSVRQIMVMPQALLAEPVWCAAVSRRDMIPIDFFGSYVAGGGSYGAYQA